MIKLTVEIASPLDDDDRDLLQGLAVMQMAIANRQTMGQPEEEPQPCGSTGPEPGSICISEVGHKGRHKYRVVETTTTLAN